MVFSTVDSEQVWPIASSTPGDKHGDPLPHYSAGMLNGDGGLDSIFGIPGNDSNATLVNGATDHDTNISNNASHFQVIGSASDNLNNSIQR